MTAGQSLDASEELLNDMQRQNGGSRVIEDVEARHGLRPPRHGGPPDTQPILDEAAIQEIESFYRGLGR